MPRLHPGRSLCGMACLVALLSVLAAPSRAAESAPRTAPVPGIFGSQELRGPLTALGGWQRVIERGGAEARQLATCTGDDAACPPAAKAWQRLLRTSRPLSRSEQLQWVNRYFNQWPYRLDPEVYGTSDYWATPAEFLREGGDCEDFSIAKYYALRQLGYRPEDLRIVVVLDTIRGIGHAVLAVRLGDDIRILDNLADAVFSHRRYLHYRPQYSVNEDSRWAHITPAEPFSQPRRPDDGGHGEHAD